MCFQKNDIDRIAKSMITEFGDKAESEAENQIAISEAVGLTVTTRIWRDVKRTIKKLGSRNNPVAE